MLDTNSPEWQPLLDLAPEHIDDFMWMCAIGLEDGTRLEVYKHYWTRRSIHLDHSGRAFVYREDERYQEFDPSRLLDLVLMDGGEEPPPYDIVRQNLWRGSTEFSWARSASKRRISRARSRYVIETCDIFFEGDPPVESEMDGRLVFLGDDATGIALEVIAVELDDASLFVIHATRLRERYTERYREAKKWPK
jgi:hypothetical protein